MKHHITGKILFLTFIITIIFIIQVDGNPSNSRTSIKPKKVFLVYTDSENSGGSLLQDISIENFLDIPCIKGTNVSTNWTNGSVTRIPIAKISMILEFESKQRYAQAVRKHENEEKHQEELKIKKWRQIMGDPNDISK